MQPLWLFPCRSGGSVEVNVTSLVPLEVTTVFLSCADTAAVLNGTLTASVAVAPPDAVLRLDTLARAFEVSVGPLSQQLDGSTRLAITSPRPRGAAASGCCLHQAVPARSCDRKNRSISAEASGPAGSVYEPLALPPAHAWPAPCSTHCSTATRSPASV